MEDKQQIMVTAIAVTWVFMLYQFFFNWTSNFTIGGLFIGFILASVAGAAAWFGYAKIR